MIQPANPGAPGEWLNVCVCGWLCGGWVVDHEIRKEFHTYIQAHRLTT